MRKRNRAVKLVTDKCEVARNFDSNMAFFYLIYYMYLIIGRDSFCDHKEQETAIVTIGLRN